MQNCFGISTVIGYVFAVLLSSAPVSAQSADEELSSFFSNQGCAIGPSTISAASAAGFSGARIETFSDAARNDPESVLTGDWVILAPLICQIALPDITSAVSTDAPEVLARTSAIDAFDDDPGCYLSGAELIDDLQKTRGWDADKANLEYIRFLGTALVSGELAFYSDDPLRTPPGFVFTGGDCADIPQLSAIKRDQALLQDRFDAFVRAYGPQLVCQERTGGITEYFAETMQGVSGDTPTNAWLGFEYQIIAMAAGWFEGMSGSDPGIPRPPFCHYK